MRHLCGICAAKDKTDLDFLHGNAVTLHLRGFYVITKVKTNFSFLQILVVDCCPEWEWMTRLRNLHGIAVILQRILRGKGQTSNSIFLIVWDGLNTSRIWRNPDVISTVYISRFALSQLCSNGAVWMIDCSNREIWNYICGKYQITFVRNMKLYLWNYQKKMEQCEWLIAQRMKYEITFVTNIRVLAEIWSCPFCVSSFGHMHSRSIPILDIIQFHCWSAQFCTHYEK